MMRPPNESKPKSKTEEQTEIERRKAASDAYANRHLTECYYESTVIRERHGVYLAMTARSSPHLCQPCADHYIPRGIQVENPYLRHQHVTAKEMDENPALELAIADAKKSTKHPLESAARPMTAEQKVTMVRTLRHALFGAQKNEIDSRE